MGFQSHHLEIPLFKRRRPCSPRPRTIIWLAQSRSRGQNCHKQAAKLTRWTWRATRLEAPTRAPSRKLSSPNQTSSVTISADRPHRSLRVATAQISKESCRLPPTTTPHTARLPPLVLWTNETPSAKFQTRSRVMNITRRASMIGSSEKTKTTLQRRQRMRN